MSEIMTEATDTHSIKIDVWSDVACPWCYVGKRKLETGIAAFQASQPGVEVEVEYHSYLLNADMPVDYEGNQTDYLAEHKGMPREQVIEMTARLAGIAAAVGLNYDFANMKMTNTVKVHQLLHYAKSKGKQLEMKERVLAAHFVEAKHVGRVADLADLAAEIGLDRDDVVRSLEANEFQDAFEADVAQAREFGITGVPFFVVDMKYGISGAQDATVFTGALETVLAERTAANA
jgi:predicted DsbA family dithiol-disulfide isomerase